MLWQRLERLEQPTFGTMEYRALVTTIAAIAAMADTTPLPGLNPHTIIQQPFIKRDTIPKLAKPERPKLTLWDHLLMDD